jgi:hypothetical protein
MWRLARRDGLSHTKSGCCSSKSFSPDRMIVWSSATRMRIRRTLYPRRLLLLL